MDGGKSRDKEIQIDLEVPPVRSYFAAERVKMGQEYAGGGTGCWGAATSQDAPEDVKFMQKNEN